MPQARSEVTRQRLIDSAVDLFDEIGYPAAGLGNILERAELTKGAFYYHFDSKESLASAIIDAGAANLLASFRSINESPGPALEGIIHGVFLVAEQLSTDTFARVATQLVRVFVEFNEAARRTVNEWRTLFAAGLAQACAEGDLRPDLDPQGVTDTVIGALLGTELISRTAGGSLRDRVAQTWELLLPAIVSDTSLVYSDSFWRENPCAPTSPTSDDRAGARQLCRVE
ncbi:TetR/AcrR family transcriptional regulator [Mycobacterium hubeiense]|uniref:TetR/AcrR family transcriptional regulator n=1 Tax=Mycobacterium hubeiense TaxID=1867256 RepID=UPI001E5442F6|nr:TetR/AcrR family transcriptional regulator [Mycobacterium sp. QGD 101]